VLIEAKDDGSGGDNWSYKSCKALVKSSPPTNQHPVFYRPKSLTTNSSWLPWGRFAMPLISPLMPVPQKDKCTT